MSIRRTFENKIAVRNKIRSFFQKLFRTYKHESKTIIVVTHDESRDLLIPKVSVTDYDENEIDALKEITFHIVMSLLGPTIRSGKITVLADLSIKNIKNSADKHFAYHFYNKRFDKINHKIINSKNHVQSVFDQISELQEVQELISHIRK